MSLTFPTNPGSGDIYVTNGLRYTYTNSACWDATAPTAMPFNYLVNPAFNISQVSRAATGVNGSFLADQWGFYQTQTYADCQNVALVTPNGSPYRLRTTSRAYAPVNATDYIINPMQGIEGYRFADFRWGTPYAEDAILRFWMKVGSSVGGATIGVFFRNVDSTRSYVTSVMMFGNDPDKEFVLVIPGDTAGTWPRDTVGGAMTIGFSFAAGTSFQTAKNAWANGNFIGITGQSNPIYGGGANYAMEIMDVGLYRDPLKTGRAPPWRPNVSEGREVQEAERYYQKQMTSLGLSNTSTSTPVRSVFAHRTPMRGNPTTAFIGTQRPWDAVNAPNLTGFSANYSNPLVAEYDFTSNGGMSGLGRGTMVLDYAPTIYHAQSARV